MSDTPTNIAEAAAPPPAVNPAVSTPDVGPGDPFYGMEEPISVETYLRIERTATEKHEYHDGHVRLVHRDPENPEQMAGASPEHLRLASNLHAELSVALRGTDCFVYGSDLRVRVAPTGRFTYPDLTVVCGEEQMLDDEPAATLLNPTLVVEVLSTSTEAYDRGEKFEAYRTLASLKTYVLVAQDRRRVDVFERMEAAASEGGAERWELRAYGPQADAFALPSVGAEVAMDALYARVGI
jgi:Uma2 family endonuclease